jgi:signal transduction histidine kinase
VSAGPLSRRFLALVVRPTAPPLWLGVLVAAGFIIAEVVLVLQLKRVAPENAFGALFLLGVLVVSAGWGFGLAVATSLASAAVYVYFHLDGAASLAPALAIFLCLALLTNVLVGQARLRAAEAEQRRLEADLSAELARSTLRAEDLRVALDGAGRRIAEVLGLPFANLDLAVVSGDELREALPLRDGGEPVGTLLIPADLPVAARVRVERIVPSLEALMAATQDRQEITAELEDSHGELSALARQQAAIRRVATLVARGAEPTEVYPVAVAEVARALEVEHVTLVRYESDDQCMVLAALGSEDRAKLLVGERFPLDGASVSALVLRTGKPARMDDYGADGAIATRIRDFGLRSAVGAPVAVDGQVRGALIVGTADAEPLPPETEALVCDFTDLVSTAIFNFENRTELKASRARIVTAADQARREFERDLHDGAQQRIVSLGLQLRALQAQAAAETKEGLGHAVESLMGVHTDLQELSRGIHPAILSRGGLGPALKTLARRSTVPVVLEVDVDRRLPESVEVAAYYVVAEALTNTVKHAKASEVTVHATAGHAQLVVSISDDGVGGALSGAGSGLIGLKDRVEAVAGHLDVSSPAGGGTTLVVTIPLGNPSG